MNNHPLPFLGMHYPGPLPGGDLTLQRMAYTLHVLAIPEGFSLQYLQIAERASRLITGGNLLPCQRGKKW